jgi:hypothetical protein
VGSSQGTIFFYSIDNETVESHGSLERNDLYKSNSDFRMEQAFNILHLVSGRPGTDGIVYYMNSAINDQINVSLSQSATALEGGSGAKGQPDVRLDDLGSAYISFGSDQSILYAKRTVNGVSLSENRMVFARMGEWHLDLGLSAIETTPGGDTLLIVGLETNGSKDASNSRLFYSYSLDGGQNWVYPMQLEGILTHGGEGRMRPRIRYYQGRFYVFYYNGTGYIGVRTLNLSGVDPQKAEIPVFLPEKDSLLSTEPLLISAGESDAIYYSITDAKADLESDFYTGPILLEQDVVIFARAFKRGYFPSDLAWSVKYVELATSIESDGEAFVSVYPNPASSFLRIECSGTGSGSVVEVLDVLGRRVYQSGQVGTSGFMEDITLDISQWSRGAYIVRVSNQNGDVFLRAVMIH